MTDVGDRTLLIREMAGRDCTDEEIAAAVGLSPATVRYRRAGVDTTKLYTHQVTLKVDADTYARILRRAEDEASNLAMVIRDLIEWGFDSLDEEP